MKKRIVLFVLCICFAVSLSGCAGAFDALNFNRKPLPNPSTPVDPNASSPERVDNVMTTKQFDDLIKNTFSGRESFAESLTISVNQSYRYDKFITSVNVLDKTTVGEDEPFAHYATSDQIYYSEEKTDMYFYNDYFLASSNLGMGFEMDDYLDDLDLTSYEAVKNGVSQRFFEVFAASTKNIYSDYTNGSKRTYVVLDDKVHDLLKNTLLECYYYTDITTIQGVSALEVCIDNNTITNAQIGFLFKNDAFGDNYSVFFDFRIGQAEQFENDQLTYYNELYPSFIYKLSNSSKGLIEQTEDAYKNMPFTATVTHTGNLFGYATSELEFSYYRAHTPYGFYNSYTHAISLSDKTVFAVSHYPSTSFTEFIKKQGEDISYVNSFINEEGEHYAAIMFNTIWQFERFFPSIFGYNIKSVTETENAFTIELEQGNEYIGYREFARLEVSKDFFKINKIEYSEFTDGELDGSITMEFDYDMPEIPSEILEFWANRF